MRRQPQLHHVIQVVGDAAQQSLLHLLPVATGCDYAAKPTLDDQDERLDFPSMAIRFAGKGQLG
jgi:hypothetical protein